jgi:hypothetical protein
MPPNQVTVSPGAGHVDVREGRAASFRLGPYEYRVLKEGKAVR